MRGAVTDVRKSLYKCEDNLNALNIYLKNKNTNRKERRLIATKYYIPGYTDNERTVARKPTQIMTKTKTLAFHEISSSSYQDYSSSSLKSEDDFSHTISSFIESED